MRKVTSDYLVARVLANFVGKQNFCKLRDSETKPDNLKWKKRKIIKIVVTIYSENAARIDRDRKFSSKIYRYTHTHL